MADLEIFDIFNAFMVCCFIAAISCGLSWREHRNDEDGVLWAIIAIATGSVFSAYVIVLGLKSAFCTFYDSTIAVVSAISSLLFLP